MSIGTNIKALRQNKGITQKELADTLFVSPQAVSRWENDEVEPSLGTIQQMAKLFEVSMDELIAGEQKTVKEEKQSIEEQVNELKETIQNQRQVVCTCDKCAKVIYDDEKFEKINIKRRVQHGRTSHLEDNVKTYCSNCAHEYHEKVKRDEIARINSLKEKHKNKRIRSFVLAPIIALVVLGILLASNSDGSVNTAVIVIVPLATFFLTACLFLDNNVVFDIWEFLALDKGIKLPFGIIFDSVIDLLVFRIVLAILSLLFGIFMFVFGSIIAGVISFFIYPFALAKNLKTEYDEDDE